jgi:5-methylcytosine-specific restriction endonuclease McrA
MEMLAMMSRSKIKGALLLNNKPLSIEDLAKIAGGLPDAVKILISELENHDVFSRLKDGTIINRRMYKEHELSNVRSEAGKHGAIKRWGLTEEDQKRLKEGRERKEKFGFPIYSLIASQRRVAARNKGKHTDIQWQKLKQAFDFSCPSCGKKEPEISLTKDHIIPVSLGGSDHISNIQPLCQSCNSSKGREKTKWQKIANRNSKKENDDMAPSASASAYASSSISFKEGVWGGVQEADVSAWSEAYPACDVRGELKKMAEWLKANPEKKKSRYRRFIVNWLARTQDRGGGGNMSGRDHRAPDNPQVGAGVKRDKPDSYWAEVRKLKARGLEGESLTKVIAEIEGRKANV